MSSIAIRKIQQKVVSTITQPLYIGGITDDGSDAAITVLADGTVTAPNITAGDSSSKIANTAFVSSAIGTIPVVPDATNLVKGKDYKGLLAEYEVTGSAVTSIDFSGLDINTHKSYRVEIELNIVSGLPNIYCFVNNDTVLANYYYQIWGGSGATYTGTRGNNSQILSVGIAGTHICTLNCIKSSGTPMFTGIYSSQLGTTPVGYNVLMYKTATVTNITQLTFTSSVASAIGIGSKIRIYRGDV